MPLFIIVFSYDGNHRLGYETSVSYLADGTKRAIVDEDTSGGILYYGPFRIDKSTGVLIAAALPGGRAYFADDEYRVDYYTTDHLGSTRIVTDKNTKPAPDECETVNLTRENT